MIDYQYSKEKYFLLHYAKVLQNKKAEQILEKGEVQSSDEARDLAIFFWKIVDQTVIDSEKNISIAGHTNLEDCCEDIMQTLRSHFLSTGYMEIWEDESDKA